MLTNKLRFNLLALVGLCLLAFSNGQCPPSQPNCRMPCDCDGAATLTPSPDNLSANLSVADAGLYNVRLASQTRCGWYGTNISVNAMCADPVPTASILPTVTTSQSLCSWTVHQPINLLAVAYVNAGTNNTLQYCWCVASAPARSQKLLSSRTAPNITFTPDVPGGYWLRLTVRQGCSPTYQHIFINATCNCQPIASAGATQTPVYTGQMPAATPLAALSGSFSYNAESNYVATTYAWSLLSWSGSTGWNMSAAPAAGSPSDLAIKFTPVVQLQQGAATTTTTLGTPTTVSASTALVSYTLGASKTPIDSRMLFPRPTTGQYVMKTDTWTTVNITSTMQDVTVNPSNFVQCAVTIFNYTTATATFQATPYDRCMGTFRVQLTVFSECGSSTDYEDISFFCASRPRANLMCPQTALYNRTLLAFNNVTIDGRDSTPGMFYTWTLINNTGAAYLSYSGNTNLATLVPLKTGTVSVRLDVNDTPNNQACPPATAYVTITIGCGRIAPAFTVTQIQNPGNYQNGQFLDKAVFNVTVSPSYPTATDIKWSYVLTQQGFPPQAPVALANPTAFPFNVSVPITNSGTFTVTITGDDSCAQSSITPTSFTATCAAGGTITPAITSPTCQWNAQTAQFNVFANASTSTVSSGRTPSYYWTLFGAVIGAQTQSTLSANLAPTSVTTNTGLTLTLFVGDGCSNSSTTTQITCNCPAVTNPFTTTTAAATNINFVPASNSSGYFGQFGNVTLFAQVSNTFVLQSTDTMTWAIASGSTNTAASQLNATSGIGPVTFTPITSGSYNLVVTWRNNCTGMFTQTFPITASCPTWTAPTLSMSADGATVAPTGQTVSFNFAQGRYPEMYFKFQLPDANILQHAPLYYTWNVLSSPAGSIWGFTQNNYAATSNIIDTVGTSVVNSYTLNTTVVRTYTRVNVTVFSSEVATLPDHGYSQQPAIGPLVADYAQTCIRPDIPGVYTIGLTAADACSSTNAQFSFTVAPCPLTATWEIISASPATSPTVGIRTTIRVTPSVVAVTQFMGKIVSAPCQSNISALTNSQGAEMSFIPDAPGNYLISISILNNCNTYTTNITVTVGCDTATFGVPDQYCPFTAPSATLMIDNTLYAKNVTVYGSNGNMAVATLTTKLGPSVVPCYRNGYAWSLMSYGCPLAYVPPPPPPPVVSTCMPTIQYKWEVISAPCNSTFLPPGNGTLFLSNQLSIPFTPDKKGIYTLRFTAWDGCSSTVQNVTVTTACYFQPVISFQSSLLTQEYCPTSVPISSVPLANVGAAVQMTIPAATARVIAPTDLCPVVVPPPVNKTCDRACVCNMAKCAQALQAASAGCYCICGDNQPPPNGGSGNSTNGGGFNNGFPTTNGGPNGTNSIGPTTPTGGSNSNTPTPNGGNTTNTVTPTPNSGGTAGTGSNTISMDTYAEQEAAAKATYQKYLTTIWAAAMTPMSVGLASSMAYNAFTLAKYKSLLFGHGFGGGGGVEMSTAPARPLV